jgi:hypothetical protein
MALIKPIPLTDPAQAFRAGLATYLAGPEYGLSGQIKKEVHLGGTPAVPSESDFGLPADQWEHNPQQVFALDLGDLSDGRGIAAARPVGWRYFAGTEREKTVFGLCSFSSKTGRWALTSVWHGDRAWEALQATLDLEKLPCVQGGHAYELRFLTIPGLLLEVFWLSSRAGGSDQIVVFPAPPNQIHKCLNKEPVYPMAKFLEIVTELSRTQLRYPARARC